MGLVPYIKTGAQHSAAGMNDLYSAMDEILSSMTSNKSLYFMNGFSRYPSDGKNLFSLGMEEDEDFSFGVGGDTSDKTNGPKKYFFTDGAKHKDNTGQCPKAEGKPEDWETLGYNSETDCITNHCGNYQNCHSEALVPAGEWGWFYKLVGQYGGSATNVTFDGAPHAQESRWLSEGVGGELDYEKEIAPLMDEWVKEFLVIDVHTEQNLALGFENSLIDEDQATCPKCEGQAWMGYMVDVCDYGTGPGTDKELSLIHI